MRRVAVTGLGAVTPLGNDAPLDLARRGRRRERDRLHQVPSTRAGFPVRDRRRGQGLRPGRPRRARRSRAGSTATSCSRSPPPMEAKDGRGPERLRPGARRASSSARRSAASSGSCEQSEMLDDRGPDRVSPYFIPSVLVDSASGQIAISLGIAGRTTRPSRPARRAHTRWARAPRSSAAAMPTRARRRHRGLHAPADPGRLLRDAGPGRGRGASAARLAAVRRDPRRVRDGRGRMRARPGGSRERAAARSDDLRRGARLRRVERRLPHGGARSRVGRSRRDDAGGPRARAGSSPSGSATSTRTEPRRRSETSPRRRRSRTSSATTPTSSPSRRRSR